VGREPSVLTRLCQALLEVGGKLHGVVAHGDPALEELDIADPQGYGFAPSQAAEGKH
jgi:hypothetical protein